MVNRDTDEPARGGGPSLLVEGLKSCGSLLLVLLLLAALGVGCYIWVVISVGFG